MRKKNSKRKWFYRHAIPVLLAVFILSLGFFMLQMWESRQGNFISTHSDSSTMKYGGKEYVLREDIESFLVLGLDKFEGESDSDSYNNDKQADFLMLFVFDNQAKTCSAIHINRDTMANVNILDVAGNKIDTVEKQIALAHTYGNGKEVSCRNVSDAVSDLLLDMKINHYISLTMDAVPLYNDMLGGVEVVVEDDFTGIDDTLIKGETVTLKGEQVLTFVRSRYGMEDATNLARMERQRQYIDACMRKTLERVEADEEFIIESSVKMSDYIVSDRSVTQLQELMEKFSAYEFVEMSDIKGESKEGAEFMEFHPDKDELKKVVIDLFYELKK